MEDRTKTIISLIYGTVFPLFGIFLYTQFNYEGVHLYNDVFLGYVDNFFYANFQWLHSLFKGSLITSLNNHGFLAFFKPPLMSAVFTWFLLGFFIAVFLKDLKKSIFVSLLCNIILLGVFLIFVGICHASFGTGTLIFNTGLMEFLDSLLTMVSFTLCSNILGFFAGRD